MMKRIIFLALLLTTLSVNAAPESLDRVAAVVNDQVITRSELLRNVDLIQKQLLAAKTPLPAPEVLQKQVLQHLIDVEVQLQTAKQAGLDIDETKLNEAIRDIAKKNNISMSDMRQQIEQQGLSYDEYRNNVKKEMIINELQQKALGPKITVNDEQVANFIKSAQMEKITPREFHLQNILIPLTETPSPQEVAATRQLAEKLVKELKRGGNFSQATVAHSAGNTALQGGDLGWRALAALPDIFAKQVVTMKAGEIAGPLQTPNGFHIIKLIAVHADKTAPVTDQQARQALYGKHFEQAVQNWLQTLRGKAFIKITGETA